MDRILRIGLLVFWAAWLTIVAASNVTNALRVVEVLPAGFAFASSNFQLVETVTAVYGTPRAVVWMLFVGVVVWQAVAAALFWQAVAALAARRPAAPARPFVVALGLFAAFMLADELCIAYPLQATHMRVFIALGVSYLIVRGEVSDPAEDSRTHD